MTAHGLIVSLIVPSLLAMVVALTATPGCGDDPPDPAVDVDAEAADAEEPSEPVSDADASSDPVLDIPDDIPSGQALLVIEASPLSLDTDTVVVVAAGEGIADGVAFAIGTRGTDPRGTPPSSSAALVLPPGDKVIQVFGLGTFEPIGSATDLPLTALELVDTCRGETPLVAGERSTLEVTCTPEPALSANVGLDRISLSGNYELDPGDPNAGSLDGSNLTELVIDGGAAEAAVTLDLDTSRFGCFEQLPVIWPEPESWTTCASTTDDEGDLVLYLAARPGAEPDASLAAIDVGDDSAQLLLRTSGVGTLSPETD